MIPEEFWKSWLAFWFMAGPTLLGFSSFLFCLYLSRRHLNAMMQALNNSRYIHLWGPRMAEARLGRGDHTDRENRRNGSVSKGKYTER